MENTEASFEKGYDKEDKIGSFWGATCLEGPQDPREEPLGTLIDRNTIDGDKGTCGGKGETPERKSNTVTAKSMEEIVPQKGKWIEFEIKLQLLDTTGNKAVKAKRFYDV